MLAAHYPKFLVTQSQIGSSSSFFSSDNSEKKQQGDITLVLGSDAEYEQRKPQKSKEQEDDKNISSPSADQSDNSQERAEETRRCQLRIESMKGSVKTESDFSVMSLFLL